MYIDTELYKAVQHGIEYLNKVKPGWHNLVNLNKLQIWNFEKCICGQLRIPEYYNDYYGFFISWKEYPEDSEKRALAWKRLEEIWREQILALRAKDEISPMRSLPEKENNDSLCAM